MEIVIQKFEKIQLSPKQVKEITIKGLQSVVGFNDDFFIEEDDLKEHFETHGSGYEKIIRKATEEDKIVLALIKKLRGE